MIDRVLLKQRGKAAFMANFWICVLVALVLTMVVSGGSGVWSAFSTRFNLSFNNNNYNVQEMLPGAFDDFGSAARSFDARTFFEEFLSHGGGVLAGVLGGVIFFAVLLGAAVNIFVASPLQVGGCRFFLDNGERNAPFETVLFPFKTKYMNIVKAMFLQNLFIFLWSLLFVIPGIVKGYAYRLVPYILAEAPDMDAGEARRRSEEMMRGHKWESFVFDLSFLGWELLGLFTCGILLIFYVNPYRLASDAELYRAIKYINYGGYVPPMRGSEQQTAGRNAQYYAPYGAPQQPYGAPQQPYSAPQQPYGGQPENETRRNTEDLRQAPGGSGTESET